MKSVSGYNWEELKINKRILEKAKIDHNFSNILTKLIISRKFTEEEVVSLKQKPEIYNPFLNNVDFENGFKVLDDVIQQNGKILIIGDYDVDGCVSTSLLINFLNLLNKNTNFYIPNRFKDGYGATLKLVKKLTIKKIDLVIMVDCGSNSNDTIKYLNSQKIKSIIIDHHEIYKPYLRSNSLINPKKDCSYKSYDYLCSSSLTYFFIDFFIKKKKIQIKFDNNLIYVLLATICDVMPLRGLNRIIAINTLETFSLKKNFFFNKVFQKKKIKRPLNIYDFGFLFGPLINSAGRLDDPNIVIELLTKDDELLKENIINKLFILNEKRKLIQDSLLKEINLEKIKKNKNKIIIVYENILNEGIIGILASKLKDYFNKPAIVMTKSGDSFKASARSTNDFNIGRYIKIAIDKKIISNGGGHNLAAGFTINKNKILELQNFLNKMHENKVTNQSKKFISKISLNSLNTEFYKDIKLLRPFGYLNSNPFFLIENIKIIKPKILNNKYVTFFIKSNSGKMFPVISFSLLDSELNKRILHYKTKMNLIVQVNENLWNNKKNLQLIVIDVIV